MIPLGAVIAFAIIGQLGGNSEKPSSATIRTVVAAPTSAAGSAEPTPSAVLTTPSAALTTAVQVAVDKVVVVTAKPKSKIVKAVKPQPKKTAKPKPKPTKTKKPTANCDPNYSGGCVPIASDVDCAGGSGNGPAYFSGTARVVGKDIYRLDADHDGIACE